MTPPSDKMTAPLLPFFAFLCSYDCQYKSNTHEKYAKKPHNGDKCRENLVEGGCQNDRPPSLMFILNSFVVAQWLFR